MKAAHSCILARPCRQIAILPDHVSSWWTTASGQPNDTADYRLAVVVLIALLFDVFFLCGVFVSC